MEETRVLDHDQRNLINLIPHTLRYYFENLPPEYLDMTEDELQKFHPSKEWTPKDKQLRIAFWKEYDRAQHKNCKMVMSNVYKNVCAVGYFYNSFLRDKIRVSFLLKRLPTDELVYEELGSLANDRLRDLLSMDLRNNNGDICPKTAAVVLKAVELALNRSKGAVLQVIHQKNLNMNWNADIKPAIESASMKTIEEIDAELAEYDSKKAIPIEHQEVLVPSVRSKEE